MNSSDTRSLVLFLSLACCARPAVSAETALIVVRDHGGNSALPYYRALHLQAGTPQEISKPHQVPVPAVAAGRYSEADLLPVDSPHLTPGPVNPRVLRAPGLRPIFLIGDDAQSRAWLQEKLETLRALDAVGLVVRVETVPALESLRKAAPRITLMPASGDDLAGRLGLQHYPVLITSTGIEQ